jgi:uncharacterized protein
MSISRRQVLMGSAAGLVTLSVGQATGGAPSRQVAGGNGSERAYRAVSEKIFIPTRDGTKLGATLVRPENPAEHARHPALFTYDPYRASDGDCLLQLGYFAEHGYYCAHVDVRGTGMSEGRTTPNEYSEQEQQDALDAIAWLSAQPWSNGNVGMYGTSYSGFNSIQVAMLHPPALKAVIPVFATDDVYTDDVVYYDGALECDALGRWPFSMIAIEALPAPPQLETETADAKYRVEHEPWIFEMLRHQTDDRFWRRMSLRPDYEAIQIPTFIVAGWLDAYTDSFPRMLSKMKAPTKAIVGPWTHGIGIPGPAIDIKFQELRWWDYWLKGIDTGIMSEPPVALYVNHSYRPSLSIAEIPGEWRYEDSWPVKRIVSATYCPQPGGALTSTRATDMKRDLVYKATVGMTNRYRCPHDAAELPVDQRADDDYSLCFDGAPLPEDMEILGNPRARLYVAATTQAANWIVRLCDLAPDGTSTLVTKGVLNGTHYESHADPQPLAPGRIYELDIQLKAISWVFPKDHRIRFAVCNADFPNLWPSASTMTTTLHVDAEHPSAFTLPICPPTRRPVPNFKPPEVPPTLEKAKPEDQWTVTRDEMTQSVTVFRETVRRGGLAYFGKSPSSDLTSIERRWMTVSDLDPAKTTLIAQGQEQRRRGEVIVTCKSEMRIASDSHWFYITARRELFVDDVLKDAKSWNDKIPRMLV